MVLFFYLFVLRTLQGFYFLITSLFNNFIIVIIYPVSPKPDIGIHEPESV